MSNDSPLPDALVPVLAPHGLDGLPLAPIPTKGVSHDHFAIGDSGWLLRAPRLSQLDLDAEAQLRLQEAAFLRAEPSGATPRLLAVAQISDALPRGGLIVERVVGRPPAGPEHLPAVARALAAIHALPTPAPGDRPPIPTPPDALSDLAARARGALETYMPRAGLTAKAQRIIADRLAWLDAEIARSQDLGPAVLCVTDAHPGNFLIRASGEACFVDLEKPAYGCPALDLAHAVIDVAAGWDPDAAMRPGAAGRKAFAEAWLAAAPPTLAAANAPLIAPLRQAVWLRTISFFMRWRAESATQGPWSAERLGPEAARHFSSHVEASLAEAAIETAAAAWSE